MSVVAVVVVVEHTSFIAKSRASLEALKSATLLKSLNINALISGEIGTGKETLAKFILPKAKSVDGSSLKKVLAFVKSDSSVIIKNFDKIENFSLLQETILKSKTRVIATSKTKIEQSLSSKFFALTITVLPLVQRKEDIEPLAKKFFKEISAIFDSDKELSLENLDNNLPNNSHSLRKLIYTRALIDSFSEDDVMHVMEKFLTKRVGSKNDYRDQLYLFDVPMLRCGFKKFKSQLNMSEKFGLNRNTLRKKINDYKDNFKLQ